MFIYSIRASTVRFFGVLLLTLAVLVTILAVGANEGGAVLAYSEGIKLDGIKTNTDRIAFIRQFGVEVNEEPIETVEFSVPKDFDRIINGYNEIQRMQGLDLSKYKNKKVIRYTYTVKTGADAEPVNVNLIVYRNTVIACDMSSASPDGFVKPLINIQ